MAVIIVTGANGQLGSELQELATYYPQHQFHFFTRAQLDISNKETVRKVCIPLQPDYCINCAAYTAVDKAETEKEMAFQINATGTENLALVCKETGCRFIHISTDYVFNGTASIPYKETDPVDPINVYGASKLKGEELSLRANTETIILRTSWVYSAHGNNFVKTMLRLLSSKEEIRVVADQYGSPTYAGDLAAALLFIVDQNNWHPGIYHYSNDAFINWFEFAQEIKEIIGASCRVVPIPSSEYPTPAKRPAYSVMDKRLFVETFNLPIQNWKDSLNKCIHILQSGVV